MNPFGSWGRAAMRQQVESITRLWDSICSIGVFYFRRKAVPCHELSQKNKGVAIMKKTREQASVRASMYCIIGNIVLSAF